MTIAAYVTAGWLISFALIVTPTGKKWVSSLIFKVIPFGLGVWLLIMAVLEAKT